MRRMMLMIGLLALVIMPAAAQDRVPVPDMTLFAEYAPATTIFYGAIRGDTGYLEQTDALMRRAGRLLENTPLEDFYEDFLQGDDFRMIMGEGIAFAVTSPDADFRDLLDDESPVMIIFGIKSLLEAQEFMEFAETADTTTERNGWKVYRSDDDDFAGLLNEEVLIIAPRFQIIEPILTGDYARLSSTGAFQTALSRLPQDRYDVLTYLDFEAVLNAQTPREANPLAGLLGQVMVGALNIGGRDLLLDAAHLYGDTSAAAAVYDFTPELMIASPVDYAFAAQVSPRTQFYAQGRGLGGMMRDSFTLLNALGGLMENEPSTRFFDLEPFINKTSGDMVKAAVTLGISAATGLKLQEDFIDVLKGEFALYAGFVPNDSADLPITFSFGVLAEESGQGDKYRAALTEMLRRFDAPAPSDSGRGAPSGEVNLTHFTRPFMAEIVGRNDSQDASLDVVFDANSTLIALGTAPSVRFALNPAAESLATTAGFQHAVASTFLPDAQGIFYVNVAGLDVVADMPEITDVVDSLAFSYTADETGITGRIAVTLQ